VEAVSVNLVKGLARLDDLDVHVVTIDPRVQAAQVTSWEGATIHRLPWAGGKVLLNAIGPGRRQMQAYLTMLKPGVVHAHDTYGIMVKGLAIPRVFTVHGFIHADTLLAGWRLAWLRSRLWKRIEEASWAEQPHIVAISPYVRERLSGIATGVIHDIENPVDERSFEVPRQERPGSIFCAAYVGPRKNTLGLLEAVSRLVTSGRQVRLRLAGATGDEAYAARVRGFIEAHGLQERVELLGSISSAQVRDELARASVFALVSFEEGAPMGIAEAMAAGVPVVASNRCGMPYMVNDAETGFLVDPHDPQDIACRLGQLLEDAGLRARLGAKAKAAALERFHPDRVAERTRRVYGESLRGGSDRYRGNITRKCGSKGAVAE
jgi:glycosyltransferase involved in cell wall biosynthesis